MNNNDPRNIGDEYEETSTFDSGTVTEDKENSATVSNENITERTPKTVKRSKGDILAKVFCFLAALLVWLYVYGDKSTSYENSYNVPVSFEAISTLNSKGYSLITGTDSTVKVRVSGTRSKINSMKMQDITVVCDLSLIHSSGEYIVPVRCDVPSGTSILSVEPSTISVYVDKSESKNIEIRPEIKSGGTNDLSVKIENLIPEFENVKITGPKEALGSISHAAVDIHLAGFIENTAEWTGELYLVDLNGSKYSNPYVKMESDSVKVKVEVNKYKTVPVNIVYHGPDAAELGYDVKLSVQSVEIRGNKDIVDRIDYVETEPVDLTEISGKTTLAVPLVIQAGTQFVNGAGKPEEFVNITVTPNNESTKKVTTKNIAVINVPDGMKAVPSENSLTVEFFGVRDSVAKLTPENVYAVADLSHCKYEGQYRVNLSIKYPDGIDGITVGGTYFCNITLKY